jgi:hypothetical protein
MSTALATPQALRPGHPRRGAAMNHDPEQLAAAYLTGRRPRARRRVEAHLLACEPCWQEVCLARRGRQLAETARDVAPPSFARTSAPRSPPQPHSHRPEAPNRKQGHSRAPESAVGRQINLICASSLTGIEGADGVSIGRVRARPEPRQHSQSVLGMLIEPCRGVATVQPQDRHIAKSLTGLLPAKIRAR